MQQKQWLNF